MVRCGVCLKAFNGRHHLEAEQPSRLSPAATALPDEPKPAWRDGDDFLIDDNFDLSLLEAIDGDEAGDAAPGPTPPAPDSADGSGDTADQPASAAMDDPAGPATGGSLAIGADVMARWQPGADIDTGDRKPEAARPRRWPWLAGSVLASLVLGLQLIYFNSLAIAPGSPLRPAVETLCALLHCPLQQARDRDAIISRDLVIRSHPARAGVLRVDALLVNTAAFDQAYPPLTLLFENLQGTVIAARTFTPEEYLGGARAGAAGQFGAGQTARVALDIIDPGADAVSYRLTIPD